MTNSLYSGDERELLAIQRLVVDKDQDVPVFHFLHCSIARSTFVHVDVLWFDKQQQQLRRILAQRSSLLSASILFFQ